MKVKERTWYLKENFYIASWLYVKKIVDGRVHYIIVQKRKRVRSLPDVAERSINLNIWNGEMRNAVFPSPTPPQYILDTLSPIQVAQIRMK